MLTFDEYNSDLFTYLFTYILTSVNRMLKSDLEYVIGKVACLLCYSQRLLRLVYRLF